MGRGRLTRVGLVALLAVAALAFLLRGEADRANGPQATGNATISAEEAGEIEETLDYVEDGDPLPYEEDGEVFRNDEMLLPARPRGYFRAYTVETPGDDDRGERRVVIGQGGEAFYTEDHYESFVPIEPEDYSARLP